MMFKQLLVSVLTLVSITANVAAAVAPRAVLDSNIANDGVVYATDPILEQAFTGSRDFTVVMLLTGEGSNVACPFCDILGPNFRTLASSYNANPEPEGRKLYFVLADFDKCMSSFRKLGLQQIPNVAVWSPTQSKSDAKLGIQSKHAFMSFKSNNDQLDTLSTLLESLGFHIKVQKPFPWEKFGKFVGTVAAVGVGIVMFRAQVLKVWQAKQIWLALSLMAVVMFIAGHMYNVTRGTAFMGHNGNGVQLIEPNFNSQLAVETQIIATLYAVLAFTTIGLIKFVPKMTDVKVQTTGALFGAITVLVVYSIFLQVFKTKMGGGYDLTLLPIKLI